MKRMNLILAISLVACILVTVSFVKKYVVSKSSNENSATIPADITQEIKEDNFTGPEVVNVREEIPVSKTSEEVSAVDVAEKDVAEIQKQETTVQTQKENIQKQETTVQTHIDVADIKLSVYDITVSVGQRRMPLVTMYPSNASDKSEIWQSSDETVATVDNLGNITGKSEGNCTVTVTSKDNVDVSATVNVTVIKGAECTYINGILIANKTYPLPEGYAPGVNAEASEQISVMRAAAAQDGISLWVRSGYRSYVDQRVIYNGYVNRDGKEEADTYSARPGHSEHQTGLAFDMNSTSNSFANTPEAAWLAANCHKYGFIIRYPKGKEHITGYVYEPWHVRYLGVEKATQVYESGLCLEEFLGITSVYSY